MAITATKSAQTTFERRVIRGLYESVPPDLFAPELLLINAHPHHASPPEDYPSARDV